MIVENFDDLVFRRQLPGATRELATGVAENLAHGLYVKIEVVELAIENAGAVPRGRIIQEGGKK